MTKQRVSTDDIELVFNAWKRRQRRPNLCRLTADRRKLISNRLKSGYTTDDLLVLFDYAWESDEPGPRWWRGDNPTGKTYLDLQNLLRTGKLAARVESALNWDADNRKESAPDNDNFGPFRLIMGGGNGMD